jgi:diguanylate cyclase (GGDEF)-like protein
VTFPRCTLLVVDDEPYILTTLQALLAADFHVLTADSADVAQQLFSRHTIDLILTDQKMPRSTGVQLLEWVQQNHPRTIGLLMTGFAELEDAVDAINRGHVYHYFLKPPRTEDLVMTLHRAAEKHTMARERERLLEELQQKKTELERLNRELEERVAERTRELEEANRQLQQRSGELEKYTSELKILVLTDPLTGLYNRRAMDDLARFELKRHSRYPSPLTLGWIDTDNFGQINKTASQTAGDEALRALARILNASVREVDSVGRVGGDEFLVIARETGFEGATTLAERIRSNVENAPIQYRDKLIPLTVTAGFAVAEVGVPADYPTMLDLAAEALLAAKSSGRNRCVVKRLEPKSP